MRTLGVERGRVSDDFAARECAAPQKTAHDVSTMRGFTRPLFRMTIHTIAANPADIKIRYQSAPASQQYTDPDLPPAMLLPSFSVPPHSSPYIRRPEAENI